MILEVLCFKRCSGADCCMRLLDEVICGGCAGVFGTLIGFPLDTIKTRLQTQPHKYFSITQSMRTIYSQEGFVRGFYSGVLPPITALTMLNMLNFSTYAEVCNFLSVDKTSSFNPMVFVAGASAGPLAAFISTPFEFVKTQMQLANISKTKYKNSIDAVRTISKESNVLKLYTGHAINTSREMLFLGTYFFTYEHVKHLCTNFLPSSIAIAAAGGTSGAMGWIISYPLDCIKGNIQGHAINQVQPSAKDIMQKLLKTKGIGGLYSGMGASVLRAFLVSSSRFSAYECAKWALSSDRIDNHN